MPGLAPADASVSRKRGPNKDADAIIAMMTKAVDISRLQLRRLRKDVEQFHHLACADSGSSSTRATTEGEFLASSAEARTALHADLHLLFMKLHEADQLLFHLNHLMSQEPELARLRNKHRAFIKRCDEYRRHMDKVDRNHFSDTGNLNENTYSFHGKKFDIGPSFEKDVEALLKDVVSSWARIRDRQRKIRDLITKSHPP